MTKIKLNLTQQQKQVLNQMQYQEVKDQLLKIFALNPIDYNKAFVNNLNIILLNNLYEEYKTCFDVINIKFTCIQDIDINKYSNTNFYVVYEARYNNYKIRYSIENNSGIYMSIIFKHRKRTSAEIKRTSKGKYRYACLFLTYTKDLSIKKVQKLLSFIVTIFPNKELLTT